jgi:2,4-diaminopentanoate dehydrogenase
MMKIRVAQFGLGPIGLETVKLAAGKPWIEVIGGVDTAPAVRGADLGKLTGHKQLRGKRIHPSLEDLLAEAQPDVILHTTVSQLSQAFEQIEPMVRRGLNVVSSCEELLFPQLRDPARSLALDTLCQHNGARVVATGVNPGFVMDLLPLCITGVSCSVQSVLVERVVNASTRRGPLQRKIGSGLPPDQFRQMLREGKAGHAGLRESLALVAHGLGWQLDRIVETGNAVVADHDIRTPHVSVKKGETCGTHQHIEGRSKAKTLITLDIKMYLDATDPQDTIRIEGNPPLDLVIRGGVAGDQATTAALVNTVPRLLRAPPGLLLMTDLAVPRFA